MTDTPRRTLTLSSRPIDAGAQPRTRTLQPKSSNPRHAAADAALKAALAQIERAP